VFRSLKLRRYVRKIDLSPEETLALMQRLEPDSCRPEDYEVLMRIVEAPIELSVNVLEGEAAQEPSLPVSKAKGRRQGAKRTRHRR
jgi:hypothetical protein